MILFRYSSRLLVSTTRSSLTTVTVSCLVEHTFPRPFVSLYTGHHRDKVRLQGVQEKVER